MSKHGYHRSTAGIGGTVHGRNDRLIDLFAVLRPVAALEPAQAPENLTWQDRALCGEVGSSFFYPEKGGSSREARSVCAGCPVRRECLADALARMGEYGSGKHGIWGGTTFNQREWLLDHFSTVPAAVAYAMDQDCTIDTVNMQPRKAAA